ncbi:MAG: hypothetical protein ACYCV6_18185, partial [Steroidobacteraceae bacterium]
MAGLEVDGSGFIEESSVAAMSDTTSDCKFQKAGVPRHIGTQGVRGGKKATENSALLSRSAKYGMYVVFCGGLRNKPRL